MAVKKIKPMKSFCPKCKRNTNHEVLAEKELSGVAGYDEITWWEAYQIIQCKGCDEVSFRIEASNTEDYDPNTGDLEKHVSIFPDATNEREPMANFKLLPQSVRTIYLEVLKTLGQGAPLLAAIGLRVLIEAICIEQGMTSKNLEKKIDELAHNGFLSTKEAEFLHRHRFMGNIAAHEISAPEPRALVAAVDIAETILKSIYILPELAEEMTPRSRRKK